MAGEVFHGNKLYGEELFWKTGGKVEWINYLQNLQRAPSSVDKDESSNKCMQGAATPAANNTPARLWKRPTAGDKAVKV